MEPDSSEKLLRALRVSIATGPAPKPDVPPSEGMERLSGGESVCPFPCDPSDSLISKSA